MSDEKQNIIEKFRIIEVPIEGIIVTNDRKSVPPFLPELLGFITAGKLYEDRRWLVVITTTREKRF